jgi:hypothetical protein
MGTPENGSVPAMPSDDPRIEGIECIDDEMARHLRALSGAERLRIADGMFAAARRMLRSHLAAEHADWDEKRLQEEVARRISGAG